ncbi:GAP1-N2 domain-containing protein [Paenibacillus antibioticophila]|uniref:GAP1-N2 domain-containing protein n=1 Tax=Paenibacillus antibioticophila TaxID=1274374 RepID=UPI000677F266|nr:hypothetical protein [Paenibacillus antibioticophila]
MKPNSPGSIQQQMYTRERKGVFRSTEGFDTVAKSSGLDVAFIKKVLHPFCMYDAPAELVSRSEKDGALYPEAVHLFHAENGETVLGRSIYQPVDFTGLRSAFLTHNYIIPSGRSGEVTESFSAWLDASFADSYDPEIGTELAELDEVPTRAAADAALGHASAKETLERLGFDEQLFKQLLFAVMTASGEGRKKVYISLDVPVEDISREALSLMQIVYSCLPYEHRRRLGFLSYVKEPQSRKFIQVQFVEKGSLRPHDRSIEKDYIFDLAAGRFGQIDADWSRQPYLDFVWSHLEQKEQLQGFFDFADEMLSGMEGERKSALSSYHELAVYYRIERGEESLYEENKVTVLRGLLEYLKPPGGLDARMRLNDLFLSRFDREFDLNRLGHIPPAAVAECFRDYFGLPGAGQEDKIVSYYILALHNAMTQERQEEADAFYTLIEGHTGLEAAFFTNVLNSERLMTVLFDPYIRAKFQRATDLKALLNLIRAWGKKFPFVLQNHSFQELSRTRLMDKLRSANQLLRAADIVMKEIGKWDAGVPERERVFQNSGMTELLTSSALRLLLSELDLDRLTKEQVVGAEFLRQHDLSRPAKELRDSRLSSHAVMLHALYRLFTEPKPEAEIFAGLGPMETDRVQQTARKWLQGEIETAEFPRIALAFFRESDAGFVEYGALLDYLRRNAADKNIIYKFLLWSQSDSSFTRPRGLVPAYAAAILAYFKRHDKNAFKSRENRREYFAKAGPALSTVLNKAKLELSSPVSRFFSGNRKTVMMGSTMMVLLILIVAASWLVLKQTGIIGKADPLPETPPVVADEGNTAEEQIVFAEKLIVADGEKEQTRLIFPFDDLAQCTVFTPTELTLTAPGLDPQVVPIQNYESGCALPKQEDSDAADTPDTSGDSGNPGSSGNSGTSDNSGTSGTSGAPTTENGTTDQVENGDEAGDTAGNQNNIDAADETDGEAADQDKADAAGESTGEPDQTGKSESGTAAGTAVSDGEDNNAGLPKESKTSPDQYAGRVTVVLDQAVPEGSVIQVNGVNYKVKAWTSPEIDSPDSTRTDGAGNAESSGNTERPTDSGND